MQSYSEIVQSNEIMHDPADAIPGYYRTLVDVLCHLSEVYYYLGHLDIAVKLLESNTYLLTADKVTLEDQVRFQAQRGKMLYYQSTLADAGFETTLTVLLDAQKLAQSSKDDYSLAKALDLLGLVFYSQAFSNGNFEKPRKYFQSAWELREKLDDRQGMSESLFHLGLTYQNMDNRTEADRQEALKCFQQAHILAQAGNFKLEESYIVRHMAAEYQEEGDWEKALAGFERSLALREQIGYKVYQPAALLAIGHVHQARSDLDRAISYYQRGQDLAEQMNEVVYVVRAQLAMGDAEKERGNAPGALRHYENALRAAKAVNYQNGFIEATAKVEGMAQVS